MASSSFSVDRSWQVGLTDVAMVVIFVVIGRNNHDAGNALDGIVKVAAPFLIGLAVGWIVALGTRSGEPISPRFGATVWVVTLLVGMLLRRTLFDGGTAAAFVVVATLFLGMTLIGWRALAGGLRRRAARAGN